MPSAEKAVERARSLVGVRYRLQGRSAVDGLDCVGLAAAALGLDVSGVPRGYSLRGSTFEQLAQALCTFGFSRRLSAQPQPGDLIVFEPGAGQLHLAIFTGSGFVHADAGLGKVVERPAPAPWRMAASWHPPGAAPPAEGPSSWPPSS